MEADPSNDGSLLPTLGPGDRLLLGACTYTQGLPIDNLNGQAGHCIVVQGPDRAPRAVFTGRSCGNTAPPGQGPAGPRDAPAWRQMLYPHDICGRAG